MIKKTIAHIAHDHRKEALVHWVQKHHTVLQEHHWVANGTTGKMIQE